MTNIVNDGTKNDLGECLLHGTSFVRTKDNRVVCLDCVVNMCVGLQKRVDVYSKALDLIDRRVDMYDHLIGDDNDFVHMAMVSIRREQDSVDGKHINWCGCVECIDKQGDNTSPCVKEPEMDIKKESDEK